MPPKYKNFEPRTPPFRARAIFLALVTLGVAVAALILLLTDGGRWKPRMVPRPAQSEWPEGFVEWEEVDPLRSAAPSASGSATPPRP